MANRDVINVKSNLTLHNTLQDVGNIAAILPLLGNLVRNNHDSINMNKYPSILLALVTFLRHTPTAVPNMAQIHIHGSAKYVVKYNKCKNNLICHINTKRSKKKINSNNRIRTIRVRHIGEYCEFLRGESDYGGIRIGEVNAIGNTQR